MTRHTTVLALLALLVAAPAGATSPPGPTSFPSAKAAADALVSAAAAEDVPALVALFGGEGKLLVDSGDAVQDRNDRARFAELAKEKLEVVTDPKDPARATVTVGPDAWPFPVPLVDEGGKWIFAAKAGLQEIVDRRIGSNELDAIEVCRGFVEAQHEYAETDHDGDGVKEYAQRVISTKGKRDGLAWWTADGAVEGPISEAIARAIAEGYTDRTKPWHGYHFRILKKQGKDARLGKMDYVLRGHMIGGFALVAWPAAYRSSGVKTFIVSHDGVVYEKDLGKDTAKVVAKMDAFDPGPGWEPIPVDVQ
ncbi:MAG: DUF2950 domain-containing protein [Anaeromyxobacteraceae bacterium]